MTRIDSKTRSDAFIDAIGRAATFAFQPIVSIHTGACFGYEALLRNVDRVGFNGIPEFFDYAWNAGISHRVDMELRQIAIAQFARTEQCRGRKLFLNIDGRIFESQDFHPHQTIQILRHYDLSPECLVLELPEKYDNASAQHLAETLRICREHNYQLAIDDFGRGFSELKMVYEHQPDYIKIDRFFIHGLADDPKKRLFVSSIVNLAHVLGTTVLAEGVETEREFLVCKDIGCDLVQGFYVARPTADHASLKTSYEIVAETNSRDRRRRSTDEFLIRDFIKPLQPLNITDDMETVFEAFRVNKAQNLFPVIGSDGSALGLIREDDLKEFIYLQYGHDLIQNKAFGKTLKDFLTRCPVVDINTEAEKIVESYAINRQSEGIIVTENFRYVGFLTADALLRTINEKNLTLTRNQNPLSKLPGNTLIIDYISLGLEDETAAWSFVYFDFNDFKPFNDTYGFRQGDRAIILFSDLLRRETQGMNAFLGHIGGDDFFAGFKGEPSQDVEATVAHLIELFSQDVESLYNVEHREAGGIWAKDKDGQWRKFSLLSICAAVIHVPAGPRRIQPDLILEAVTREKTAAKQTDDGISASTLNGAPTEAA